MSDSPVNPLILIGAGSSFALSALFYHLYQEKKEEIKKLREIPVFRADQQLLKVLKASPYRRLLYVAVEGVVQAEGKPLASRFVPECFGVIQKIVQEEQWKYWNSVTRTWNSRTVNKTETKNSVPFSLVSPGAYISDVCVKVHSPLEASGCFTERVFFRMRRAEEGLMDIVLQGVNGEKPVAMQESEEMLCVGSNLTGFGEVVLEGNQVLRLQPPQNGRKYVLVPSSYRNFMDGHEASASMWKILTAATGITGASLLASVVYKLFNQQDDRSK